MDTPMPEAEPQRGEHSQLQHYAAEPAKALAENDRAGGWQFIPPRQIEACPERSGAEGDERHDHARATPTHGEERARAAPARELHAAAKDQRADHDRE
jgi:hypothetical protein